jgi:fucose 4-O-acetylase-like acetyltransferase
MVQRRILWLDQLKAVGFYCVILGHMCMPASAIRWIYSFHMPLFFLVSGFTFNWSKTAQASARDYLPKLCGRLLLPYFWIELICLCFSYLNTVLMNGKELHLTKNLLGILVGNGLILPYPTRPMYFALVLFLAQVLLWVLLKLAKGNKTIVFASTLMLCAFSFLTMGKPMVWQVNVVPVAMLLILCGTLLRKLYDRLQTPIETGNPVWLYLIGVVLFAAGFVLQYYNGRLSMAGNRYGKIIPVGLLAAVLTTCALALFLIRLPVPKVMQIIGQNTFFYMGFHRPLITLLENLFPTVRETWWFLTAGSLLIFFGLVPVVLLVNKTCAFLCCKETHVETRATLIGKYITVFFAFLIPYKFIVLYIDRILSGGGTTLHVVLTCIYPILCAGVCAFARRKLPYLFLLNGKEEAL